MFIFHPFHFSQFLSCTAQIHLEYLFMFPSIPLFPPFTVIYPLSVSASVSETPIYSNSIPYRTAHSLWNKVFFSIAVQWTADTPAPFLPPPHNTLCHQHPIAHGLTYHHFDSGLVDLFLMGSACSSVNLDCEKEVVCVLHTEQMSLCLPYKWMRARKMSRFRRSAWLRNECIFSS